MPGTPAVSQSSASAVHQRNGLAEKPKFLSVSPPADDLALPELPSLKPRKSIPKMMRRQSTLLSEALETSTDGMMRITEARNYSESDDFESEESTERSHSSRQTVKTKEAKTDLEIAVDLVTAATSGTGQIRNDAGEFSFSFIVV